MERAGHGGAYPSPQRCDGEVSPACAWMSRFVKEPVFSPMYVFFTFVENQMAVAAWAYFCILCSIPLVYMSVFLLVPCCFCYCDSVVESEVRYCDNL
jgi:hypothetical protein